MRRHKWERERNKNGAAPSAAAASFALCVFRVAQSPLAAPLFRIPAYPGDVSNQQASLVTGMRPQNDAVVASDGRQ